MGLINIPNLQNGDNADASIWNTRFNTIATEINGNLNEDNIADGAVTEDKIADGAVTADKLGVNAVTRNDGWISTDDTWTYASASTFTVPGDKTGQITAGCKIKLTQTTDKFFIVTNSSHADGTTTVTVNGFTISTLANAAITNPFYSYCDMPAGFPQREVTLFSGTAARIVSISEAYTRFKRLQIVVSWLSRLLPIQVDTANATYDFPVVASGLINDVYKIVVGSGSVAMSGTTITGSSKGSTYSMQTTNTSNHSFSDNVDEVKIVRVTGIRY